MDEKRLEEELRKDARRLQVDFSPTLHQRLKESLPKSRQTSSAWQKNSAAVALACTLFLVILWLGSSDVRNSEKETSVLEPPSAMKKSSWETGFPWADTVFRWTDLVFPSTDLVFRWTDRVVLQDDVSDISSPLWDRPPTLWTEESEFWTEESQFWMEQLAPFSIWTVAAWSLDENWNNPGANWNDKEQNK